MQGILEEAKRASEVKKTMKMNKEGKREHQLIFSFEMKDFVRKSLSREDRELVLPRMIAIRIIQRLPPHLRSLDVPFTPSVKSYKIST